MKKKNIIIGLLIIVLSATGILITMENAGVRMNITKASTTFSINENGNWLVSGVEYSSLYDTYGTKLTPTNITLLISPINFTINDVYAMRIVDYPGDIKLIETYYFDSASAKKENFPVRHTITITGATGYTYRYDAKKLVYTGITMPIEGTSASFGRNMKLEWDSGTIYQRITQAGTLTLKYLIGNDSQTYNIRLFDPYPDGWTKCKNITINYPLSTTLTNFPIYLNITFDADMQADMDDLRFYAGGCGGTGGLLFAELESKTDSQNSYVWVKNNLTTGNNTISMYYGNSTVTSNWDYVGNVWDIYYTGVYLLNGTNDSTSYEYNGVESGGALATTGIIGGAYWFDNVNDEINITNPMYFLNNTNYTFSAWIKHQANASSDVFFSWYDATGTPKGGFRTGTSGGSTPNLEFVLYNGSIKTGTSSTKYQNDTWTYVTYVVNSSGSVADSTIKYYKDGIYTDSDVMTTNNSYVGYVSAPDATTNAYIGSRNTATWFLGYIDELTISNTIRSDDWINMTYQLIANHATFVTYGVEETLTSGSVSTNFTIWNGTAWEPYVVGGHKKIFRCYKTQQQCEPDNQSTAGSQSIFQICNNGTTAGTSVEMNINVTNANINVLCDDDNTYAGATTLSTSNQTISGALASTACVNIYCWADYNTPTSLAPFRIAGYVAIGTE